MKYMIVLDQGTTSTRAIIFNQLGQVVAKSQEEFQQYYPKPGYVEHDPIDILSTVRSVISTALTKARLKYSELLGIGIANQRETVVMWDKTTGEPVYHALVWQCRRTVERCKNLKVLGYESIIRNKTGLRLDSYFSATKIEWLLENVPKTKELLKENRLLVGTIDTYLMWQLSGGKIYATDYTNASRTMLYNIHDLCWDEELCSLFHVPMSILPEVYPSSHIYGWTDKEILGFEIPICAVAGDQQSALFGQCCFEKSDLKVTYGTGCFLLMNTKEEAVMSSHGLITTLNCQTGKNNPSYALEGSVFVGGAVIQWLRDELQVITSAQETEAIARSVEDTNGVYIVPAFVGLGAPYWNFNAEGLVTGITRGTNRKHLVRACLESIAYEVFDVVKAMEEDLKESICNVKVDGGAVANNFLMEFQSNILPATIFRPENMEVTALGAFFLGAMAMDLFDSLEDIKKIHSIDQTFSPSMTAKQRVSLLDGWHKAIRKATLK